MAQAGRITKEEVRHLIQACFAKLTEETERNAPTFVEPHREIYEQHRMIDERLSELSRQIRSGKFEAGIVKLSEDLLRAHGVEPGVVPAGITRDLMEGIGRAFAEQQRLYAFRLEHRLLPYAAEDPIFAADEPPFELALQRELQAHESGPTVAETVSAYLAIKRKRWTAKTYATRERQLALLLECLGPSKRIGTLLREDIRRFRDGVQRFRRNHHVGASTSFAGRQTENAELRIDGKTVLLHLENARTFLRWAVSEGYLQADPSAGLSVELPKKAKSKKVRRPATAAELAILFGAPTFRGCQSAKRRYEPGHVIVRDAQFWLPILGYYTGARMGELVQLHLRDVHADGPFPYLEITDQNGGDVGTGTEKHVKSVAGVRRVPIHPHVMELGFAKFVAVRRADKRRWVRLFYEIKFGADGQPSTTYSKRFARLLDKAGLSDPALCFHSFRHGVEDALREIEKPQYVIDRIVGHSDDSVSAGYGQGVSLEVAHAAVSAMKLPLDLRAILQP